jgi:hypothetical protein
MAPKEIKPLMLSTQQLVQAYWPQVEPLLATAPIAEEFPPHVVKQALLSGQMFLFVFKEDTAEGPLVELVLLLAPSVSESFPVMNILTIAGKNLKANVSRFWEYFQGWCVINGARAIDAYVPERMVKFLDGLGLKKETVHVRLRL